MNKHVTWPTPGTQKYHLAMVTSFVNLNIATYAHNINAGLAATLHTSTLCYSCHPAFHFLNVMALLLCSQHARLVSLDLLSAKVKLWWPSHNCLHQLTMITTTTTTTKKQQCSPLLWPGSTCTLLKIRGVRNPMKMSDIGFLKTEPNQTDPRLQKPKTQFPQLGFQKTDFGSLRAVFHVVSSTIHLPTW